MNFTEFLESKKPLPMGKMVLKALSKDKQAEKEPDIKKKTKLENQARVLQMTAAEQIEFLLSDPLEDLYHLAEAEMNVMPKPDFSADVSGNYESPHKGQFEHPVTKQKNEIDSLIAQGTDPMTAHQSVHGDLDPSTTTSKAQLAATLGRLQDDGTTGGVKIEPEKESILAKDARIEKQLDQVTDNDLKTQMNLQVPDREQTPQDQVSEELDFGEEYDYNEDVAYLQQFGRA